MPKPIFKYLPNLLEELPAIPSDSIVSRTCYGDAQMKLILFGFAPGQELSEHTAARPAVLHFLQGEATLKLGEQTYEARPGAWVHMEPNLSHSILAKTQVIMLLILL